MVTALDIQTFIDRGAGPMPVSNAHIRNLEVGAAYNPTTGAFSNHGNGQTYHDIGGFNMSGTIGDVSLTVGQGSSFALGSTTLSVGGARGGRFAPLNASGPLTVQEAPSAPVPEPATLSVFGVLGVSGLVAAGRKVARRGTPA